MQAINKPIEKGMVCYATIGDETFKLRICGPSPTQPRRWICEDFATGSYLVLAESKLRVTPNRDDSESSPER